MDEKHIYTSTSIQNGYRVQFYDSPLPFIQYTDYYIYIIRKSIRSILKTNHQ